MNKGDKIIDLNSKPYVLAGAVEASIVEEWPTQYRTTGLQQRDDRAQVSQWVIDNYLGGASATNWHQDMPASKYSSSTIDTRFVDHFRLGKIATTTTAITTAGFTPSTYTYGGICRNVGYISGVATGPVTAAYYVAANGSGGAATILTGWSTGGGAYTTAPAISGVCNYFGAAIAVASVDGGGATHYFGVADTVVFPNVVGVTTAIGTIVHVDTAYIYCATTTTNVNRYTRAWASGAAGWTATTAAPITILAPQAFGSYAGEAATFSVSGEILYVTTANGTIASQEAVAFLPYGGSIAGTFQGKLVYVVSNKVFLVDVNSSPAAVEEITDLYVGGQCTFCNQDQIFYASTGGGIQAYTGTGWHVVMSDATPFSGLTVRMVLPTLAGSAIDYICTDGSAWASRSVTGVNIGTGNYSTTGQLTTPIFGGDMDETTGTFFKLKCVGTLTATETVTVTYGLDGAAATTTALGAFNDTTSELTLGVTGRTIQFKFTFARGSTVTNTPDVSYFILYYLKQPTGRLEYRFNIDMEASCNELKRDTATMYEELVTAYNAAPVTLKWNGADKTVKVLGVKSSIDAKENKYTAQSVPKDGIVQVWAMEVP